MEFNARYALTGIFSLTVIAAIFAFVYWVDNAGGFGAKSNYKVRFSVPVSGIATGGNVMFNGLKVGEITKISLDQNKPAEFFAVISILKDTPVNEDTKAGVDYQGLTGSANILLTGGKPGSPKLLSKNNELPELVADPADSRSWTQNAGRVLARIDNIFGKNSDRFDSIIAGLERMTGGDGAENEGQKYDLSLPVFETPLAFVGGKPDWQLVVSEPTIVLALNTDKVQQEIGDTKLAPLNDAVWTDNLPNLFQSKIIQSFENAGFAEYVLRPDDVLDAQYRLVIDIRSFHYSKTGSPAVMIDMMAKLVDMDGMVVASRRFNDDHSLETENEPNVIEAFNILFQDTMIELVKWSAATL